MNPPDLIGTVLDSRYELTHYIGRGGFAWVYQATDRTDGSSVAVKLLIPGSLTVNQAELENEGKLLDKLRSARNVVDLLGATLNQDSVPATLASGASVGVPVYFLVLELMDGTLADLLGIRGTLAWEERMMIFREVVAGAHQMHQRLIFHRDFKSENVLLRQHGKSVVTKVGDLGRGRDYREAMSTTFQYEVGRGDFRFAPPEFLWAIGTTSDVAFREADVYLLGSVLFELATGQMLTSLVFPNPAAWISRALAVRPADRYQDYQANLPAIRSRYSSPLSLFDSALPPSIRTEAASLIRQLCDPDPTMRTRRSKAERHTSHNDLQWLLRRVDILLRRLGRPGSSSSAHAKGRKAN